MDDSVGLMDLRFVRWEDHLPCMIIIYTPFQGTQIHYIPGHFYLVTTGALFTDHTLLQGLIWHLNF